MLNTSPAVNRVWVPVFHTQSPQRRHRPTAGEKIVPLNGVAHRRTGEKIDVHPAGIGNIENDLA